MTRADTEKAVNDAIDAMMALADKQHPDVHFIIVGYHHEERVGMYVNLTVSDETSIARLALQRALFVMDNEPGHPVEPAAPGSRLH